MSGSLGASRRTLSAAEDVAALLSAAGVDAVLIGAGALAVHGHPRSTEDLDLAVGVAPERLGEIARILERAGWTTEISAPDEADPLGGVLRASAAGSYPIEIVNFCNPPSGGFPALIAAAVLEAAPLYEGSPLRVVTLPHLVLFKLYSGGAKSKGDVLELLSRNPGLDLDELRAACRAFRLDRRLDAWLRDLARSASE